MDKRIGVADLTSESRAFAPDGVPSFGTPVRRREDARLVAGNGRFADDLAFPQLLHAAIVRSAYAHALIRSLDVSAARAAPGVVAVLTATEAAEDGLGLIPTPGEFSGPDGTKVQGTPRPLLCSDRVRHLGEPVALVVAESRGPGAGRGRAGAGRIRGAARSLPGGGRDRAGRAGGVGRASRQRRDPLAEGRCGSDCSCKPLRRPCDARGDRRKPRHRRAARTAHGDRLGGRRAAGPAHEHAGPAQSARRARPHRLQDGAVADPRDRGGCRRLLRHEVGRLPRGRARPLGGAAAGPAGALGELARGGVPRPTSRRATRTSAPSWRSTPTAISSPSARAAT